MGRSCSLHTNIRDRRCTKRGKYEKKKEEREAEWARASGATYTHQQSQAKAAITFHAKPLCEGVDRESWPVRQQAATESSARFEHSTVLDRRSEKLYGTRHWTLQDTCFVRVRLSAELEGAAGEDEVDSTKLL